jgi:hypothetical protein
MDGGHTATRASLVMLSSFDRESAAAIIDHHFRRRPSSTVSVCTAIVHHAGATRLTCRSADHSSAVGLALEDGPPC